MVMSSTSKVGLGYEIKSNNEVLSYEEEMNRSMFKCTAEDYINKPLYSRFTKTNSFKGVPHPLTRDYTPKPQEEGKFDDSFEVPVEYSEHSSEVLNQKSIIQLNAVRKNVNSVRPNVNTGRVNVNSIRHNVKSVRINVNIGRSKQPVPTCNSNSFSPVRPQGNWGTTVKTTAGYNWRNSKLNSNCDSGPTFIRTMNAKGPQGRPKPEKAWCMLRAHDVQETKLVATSTIEAEYVAAASCRGQVLWIQNQMLDYGFTFMNTKIHINNESTICIVKNPVYQSKTKHIEIRHHFIRDSYEKKLIRVEKVHTDFNVADLLTKAFDGPRLYLDCIGAWIKVELKLCKVNSGFKSGRPMLILVGFLKKPEGSAGFEQIVDFLKGTHIRYDDNNGEPL
ncbi:hypothetical protein Tco_0005875 [Tanacetum coccineum]